MKKSLVLVLGLALPLAAMAQESGVTTAHKPAAAPKVAAPAQKPPAPPKAAAPDQKAHAAQKAAQVPSHVSASSSTSSTAAAAQKDEPRTADAPTSTAATVANLSKKPHKKAATKATETQPEVKPQP